MSSYIVTIKSFALDADAETPKQRCGEIIVLPADEAAPFVRAGYLTHLKDEAAADDDAPPQPSEEDADG